MGKMRIIANINDISRETDFINLFEKIKDKPFPEKRIPMARYLGQSHINERERYYISDKKYYIFEEEWYENRAKERVQTEPFLGVELIEVSSKRVVGLDLLDLCRNKFTAWEGKAWDKKIISVESDSFINQYIYDAKKRVKPYITNKELVDIFIKFVNNRYLYFDIKYYKVMENCWDRKLLNARFVDSIVRPL